MDINGGWQIGPFLVCAVSKRGRAFLRLCDSDRLLCTPREAVRFSLDPAEALFLSCRDAQGITATLVDAGMAVNVTNILEIEND